MHFIVGLLGTFDTFIQWGFGWRYLLSPSFRRSVHNRWHYKSRAPIVAEAIFALVCFVAVNTIIALILWRVLVGPIPSVHEW